PESRTFALLVGRETVGGTDAIEGVARQLGDAAVVLPARVPEEAPVIRVGRLAGHARLLERNRVVPARVAAAMIHADRVRRGDRVEMLPGQRALGELGVV